MYFIALIMLNFVQNVFDFPLIRSLLSRSDFRYKLYPLPGRTSTFCFLVSFGYCKHFSYLLPKMKHDRID